MRKPRVLEEGATYHVFARANHRELLLEPEAAKQMFLAVVAQARARFEFHLENFVLMGNHFHFMIRPSPGASLSSIMKWILQTFAIRYNKSTGLWGHFWGDRFASSILRTVQAMSIVFEYLDNNPVAAGLVSRPEEWRWGALWLRKNGPPAWLGTVGEELRSLFANHAE